MESKSNVLNGSIFDINRIKVLNERSGRSIPEKVIPCLWDGNRFICGHKKVRVENIKWKQYVPVKQYCGPNPCGKAVQNFRSRLTKKLLYGNKNEKLTAEYCLWKMIRRTPIKVLSPTLSEGFRIEFDPLIPFKIMFERLENEKSIITKTV